MIFFWKKNWKKSWKNVENRLFSTFFWRFSTFFQKNFQHIFFNFFGIFELSWQSSQFWLRWNNFIFSKWLSYSRFTKSVLPSSQVENVTAYHPSTICTADWTDYPAPSRRHYKAAKMAANKTAKPAISALLIARL